MKKFISEATDLFSKIDTRTMFITIHDYVNEFDEVATHSVLWHVDYKKTVEKSLKIMEDYVPSIEDCIGSPFTLTNLKNAHAAWQDSLKETLELGEGNNHLATSAHAYTKVLDCHGQIVPGIKLHIDQDILHLTSLFRIKKIVHKKGSYNTTNHSQDALAKAFLRNKTPLMHWGQYKLTYGKFKRITVCKRTITEEDVIRKSMAT